MKRAPLVLVAALAAVQAGAETALPVQIVEVQATQVSEVISLIGTVAAANSHPPPSAPVAGSSRWMSRLATVS